jgi:hypothetical protein
MTLIFNGEKMIKHISEVANELLLELKKELEKNNLTKTRGKKCQKEKY